MFHKLHLRLTLMCAGITAFIMIVMSVCYLYVSEQSLYKSQFFSFRNDMNTIITNLEQQSVITFEWLSKMESQNGYTIFALDNGVPFLYNDLKNNSSFSNREALLKEGLSVYLDSFLIDSSYEPSPYTTYHTEFAFTSPSTNEEYYCSVAIMERNGGSIQFIIFSPLHHLRMQIFEQRVIFILIDIFSVIVLTLFSWFFTLRLLKPVEESRLQQVQFVASASHELRTPLSVISSCASAGQKASPEKAISFMQTIEGESMRMAGLIDDMLTLSTSDAHKWSMNMEPVQPDTLLINAFEAFEPMAEEKGLKLSVNLPDIPLTYCYCDKSRIEQVLSILLHNAISYTPHDGSIILSLRLSRHHAVLSVSDNGPGIPSSEKEKVFRRFYRIEKARSAKGHSGLGLSIAYEIIQAHHGSIKIKDTPGGGTTFEVSLPIENEK